MCKVIMIFRVLAKLFTFFRLLPLFSASVTKYVLMSPLACLGVNFCAKKNGLNIAIYEVRSKTLWTRYENKRVNTNIQENFVSARYVLM